MKEVIIENNKVNIWAGILAVILLIVCLVPFFLIYSGNKDIMKGYSFLVFFTGMIAGTVIHELIHGFFFGIFAQDGFKAVTFGFNRNVFCPYCHCKDELHTRAYQISLIMPTIILGVIPVIISYIFPDITLLLLGSVMVIGGGGDIILLWMSRNLPKNAIIKDHPSKVGFTYEINPE